VKSFIWFGKALPEDFGILASEHLVLCSCYKSERFKYWHFILILLEGDFKMASLDKIISSEKVDRKKVPEKMVKYSSVDMGYFYF